MVHFYLPALPLHPLLHTTRVPGWCFPVLPSAVPALHTLRPTYLPAQFPHPTPKHFWQQAGVARGVLLLQAVPSQHFTAVYHLPPPHPHTVMVPVPGSPPPPAFLFNAHLFPLYTPHTHTLHARTALAPPPHPTTPTPTPPHPVLLCWVRYRRAILNTNPLPSSPPLSVLCLFSAIVFLNLPSFASAILMPAVLQFFHLFLGSGTFLYLLVWFPTTPPT